MTHRNRLNIDFKKRRLNPKPNLRLKLFATKIFGLRHNFLHNLLKESSEGHLRIDPMEGTMRVLIRAHSRHNTPKGINTVRKSCDRASL